MPPDDDGLLEIERLAFDLLDRFNRYKVDNQLPPDDQEINAIEMNLHYACHELHEINEHARLGMDYYGRRKHDYLLDADQDILDAGTNFYYWCMRKGLPCDHPEVDAVNDHLYRALEGIRALRHKEGQNDSDEE